MFPPELERDAFRAGNGELGWAHAEIPLVVEVLGVQVRDGRFDQPPQLAGEVRLAAASAAYDGDFLHGPPI